MSDDTVTDQWAQVEIMGHRVRFGRIADVARAGVTMLRIDVPTDDPTVFSSELYGGAAIFSITPCTEDSARAYAAQRRRWETPQPPVHRLPSPDPLEEANAEDFPDRDEDLDDDERRAIADLDPGFMAPGDEADGLASHG